MYRTALRNVLAHKARLLMTTLAVLLGTAFVAGTLVFTDTLGSAMKSQNAKSYTDIAVTVSDPESARSIYGSGGTDSSAPVLTEDVRRKIAALPGAADARGVVSGFAGIADQHGRLIGDGFSTTGTNYVPGPDGSDARYPLVEGRGPTGSGEVALDSRTAQKGGFKVGDTVRVAVNGPVMQLKLTGIVHTNDPRVSAGGSLAAFDTATAQSLYLSPGRFSEVDIRSRPGTDDAALLTQVKGALPAGNDFSAQTGRQLAQDQDKMIAEATKGMSQALLVFAGISLFVGIFIIANTFTMLVAQRTRELALLRAVGASRKQITRSVLAEAVLIGAIASVAGLLAGTGIAAGLQWLLISAMDTGLPDGPLVIAPATVLTAVGTGVLVTVLAAWLPARRASRISPVAAMSSGDQPATQKSLLLRNAIGAVLALAGLGALAAGSASKATGLVAAGAGVVLLGVFVLTPLLSRPLIALFTPLLRRLYGMPGKLARENALRNPRRTAATASALTIGVTLITGLTVIGASVNQAVDKASATDLTADYTVAMANFSVLSSDVGTQIAKAPGVSASSVQRSVSVRVGDDTKWLTGVNADTIGSLVKLKMQEGSADALKHGQLLVSQGGDPGTQDLKLGDTLAVTYPDGTAGRLTVGGVLASDSGLTGTLAPDALIAPHSKPAAGAVGAAGAMAGLDKVLVKGEHGPSAQLKQALTDATGGNPLITVKSQQDLRDESRQMITSMLNIMYGLLGMSVVVAVLGVVNTMAMSVFERRREIGMLRAIGLDRRGVRRTVRLESLLISLLGGVLGIGLGVLIAWAANGLLRSSLPGLELVVPPLQLAGFLLAAAVIGLLAALWPARRAARLDILDSIKAA
ncbi:putative ABC transport system permease protein [Kitasatospora sp. MAA4]|uniref:ABC transporter permease n=1 Tax=Kitasatospora sp. MAA4 TaxID=3035093 RepID=UPI0024744BB9|nr:FtsX-like permease family protein [Kitasatospora sp. MAA4]MDH6136724.1 putative ABC transport system permease protein [Kitasatospora sp. MAA4]